MPPRTAKFIWNDPHGQGRNRYVLFRKSFNLVDQPAEALLHLFADTRYRLIVNGRTVAHGPARFFVVKPEYDTHDLLPFLRKGRNVIAIIVNSYGCVSFHSEVSIGGLIAWGAFADASGNTIQLATDESWRLSNRRATAAKPPISPLHSMPANSSMHAKCPPAGTCPTSMTRIGPPLSHTEIRGTGASFSRARFPFSTSEPFSRAGSSARSSPAAATMRMSTR